MNPINLIHDVIEGPEANKEWIAQKDAKEKEEFIYNQWLKSSVGHKICGRLNDKLLELRKELCGMARDPEIDDRKVRVKCIEFSVLENILDGILNDRKI